MTAKAAVTQHTLEATTRLSPALVRVLSHLAFATVAASRSARLSKTKVSTPARKSRLACPHSARRRRLYPYERRRQLVSRRLCYDDQHGTYLENAGGSSPPDLGIADSGCDAGYTRQNRT